MDIRETVESALKENGTIPFVGPFTSKIGDVPYITVTSYGRKPEGGPLRPEGDKPFTTEEEAVEAFLHFVRWECRLAAQFAWRRFPAIDKDDDGNPYVSARFAVLGTLRLAAAA